MAGWSGAVAMLTGLVMSLMPVPPTYATYTVPLAPTEQFEFLGHGAGHGVGMSQWGARGRALAGQPATQIVAAYYPGATLVTQGDDSQPIRVLLTTGKVQSFPMKTYLASVVASEMPSNWPVAALEAQAIASRTYARWESDPTKPYDVTSTVSTQVFGQPAVPSTIAAVQATAGQVLTDGTWVIPAYYHSCSPYRTDSNAAVWPNQQPNPYLSGIDDRDAAGVPYADACPSMSWQAGPFSVTDFSAILNADPRTTVGQVQTLLFGTLSPGGRWETITIQGDKGSKTVDLSVFREVMNKSAKPGHVISSANFQIVTVAPAVPGTPPPAISFIQ